jgi:hypothetical protein
MTLEDKGAEQWNQRLLNITENTMEVSLDLKDKCQLSELINKITAELAGKYNKNKDALKLKEYSKEGDLIHLVYEVIKGGATQTEKGFSSPYKEVGGRKAIFD